MFCFNLLKKFLNKNKKTTYRNLKAYRKHFYVDRKID